MSETSPQEHDIRAAVSLIYNRESEEFLVLRRAAHPKDPWSYQIALPGGRREEGESPLDTARRETQEECGVDLSLIKGQALPPKKAGKFANKSLWVQPFLFYIKEKPQINIDPREVDTFFWVSTLNFCSHRHHAYKQMSPKFSHIQFPVFPIENSYIWGFTYHVLVNVFNQLKNNSLMEQEEDMIKIEKAKI